MTRRVVHPMPEREDLPPEIAAMGIPVEDDEEQLIVVLNASEDPAATYHDFRPGVLIPALLGWTAEKSGGWVRNHQLPAAITTTAISAALIVTGIHAILDDNGKPLAQPTPQTSTVTVAPPSTAATRRAETPPPATARDEPSPTTAAPPARLPDPPGETREENPPDPRRTPSRSAPPATSGLRTSRPAEHASTPSEQVTAETTRDVPDQASRTSTPPEPPPATSAPEATSQPPAPEPSAVDQDCAIQIDLDPLLDVCVLS